MMYWGPCVWAQLEVVCKKGVLEIDVRGDYDGHADHAVDVAPSDCHGTRNPVDADAVELETQCTGGLRYLSSETLVYLVAWQMNR